MHQKGLLGPELQAKSSHPHQAPSHGYPGRDSFVHQKWVRPLPRWLLVFPVWLHKADYLFRSAKHPTASILT